MTASQSGGVANHIPLHWRGAGAPSNGKRPERDVPTARKVVGKHLVHSRSAAMARGIGITADSACVLPPTWRLRCQLLAPASCSSRASSSAYASIFFDIAAVLTDFMFAAIWSARFTW